VSRVEHIAEGVTLYLGDCREIVPGLPDTFAAVVTDPPYGLGEKWQGGRRWRLHHEDGMGWDANTVEYVTGIPSIAPDAIIWGGHLYDLPPKRGWLVWDKIVRNFTSGVMEFAWTTLDQPIKAINFANGELASEGKFHPTQKPLPVMRWCIQQLPNNHGAVLDPFMGSGTTGVAAVEMGRPFVGIEIDSKHFDTALRRIDAATKQQDMFIAKPKPPKQLTLLDQR